MPLQITYSWRSFCWLTCWLLGMLGWQAPVAGGEPLLVAAVQHAGPVNFEQEILPILAKNCLACHNAAKPESELILETPQTILKGGAQGPAVIPGKPDESLLLIVAAHRDEPVMPPVGNTANAKNLTPEELGLLKSWISQGAQGAISGNGKSMIWQPLPAGVNSILAVAISPDGRLAATGRANQIDIYFVPPRSFEAHLIDPELAKDPRFAGRGLAHLDMVESLAFSPDGEWLASGSFREVKFWKRPHQLTRRVLAPPAIEITSLAVSANRTQAAVAFITGAIQIYDLKTGQAGALCQGHQGQIPGLEFTPWGEHLVSGGQDQTVRLWDTRTGQQVGGFTVGTSVTALALAPALKRIVLGSEDGIGRVYQQPEPAEAPSDPLSAGVVLHEFPGTGAAITLLKEAGQNGSRMVAACADGRAHFWNVNDVNLIRSVDHGAPISSLAVRSNGQRLATASMNGSARLWNLETGALITDLNDQLSMLDQLEARRLTIARAERELSTATLDVGAAETLARESQATVEQSVIELTKSEVEFQRKTAALPPLMAGKLKAEQELAARKTELATAEAKVKELRAATLPDDDDAARKRHAEQLQQAQALLMDVQAKVDLAEKETANAAAAAEKASDEKVTAGQAIEAAKRTLQKMRDAAAKSMSAIDEVRAQLAEQEQAVMAAQLALGKLERRLRFESQAIQELRADKTAADLLVAQLQTQLKATPATQAQIAAGAQPLTQSQIAARDAEARAFATWNTARAEARETAEQGQAEIAVLNLNKVAAERAVNVATQRQEAAMAVQQDAVKLLAELEQKHQAATDESEKMIVAAELQNAQQRQQIAIEDIEKNQAVLQSATAAKATLDQQLLEVQASFNDRTQTAGARVNEALQQLNMARETHRAADLAIGGHLSVLASAKKTQELANAALAEKCRPVTGLVFSPDGQRLLVSDLQQVRIYSSEGGEPVETIPVDSTSFLQGQYVNDRELLVVEPDQTLSLLDTLRNWTLKRRIGTVDSSALLAGTVAALDFNPQGTLLATGGGEAARSGELKIWDAATGALVRTIENAHSDMVLGVSFSPDGKFLASCGADRFMKVFDVTTGALLKSFEGHTNHVLGVSWRSDGRLLATASADKTCKVWDFVTGEAIRTLTGYTKDVTSLQYMAATDQFVTSSGGPPQVVIRTSVGGTGATFPGTTDFIYCVRVNRDGDVVIAGGQDSVLHIWNGHGAAIVSFAAPRE